MNIVLIGARGSGKSAVAQALAKMRGMQVVSSDAEIERRTACRIKDFVEEKGWEAFRDLESEVVRDLSVRENTIIDTGGGVVLRQANVDALRRHGKVFWLRAPADVLAARIKDDTNRPSLTGAKTFVDEIVEVLAERTPLYAAAADHAIDTAGRAPSEIAGEIAAFLH